MSRYQLNIESALASKRTSDDELQRVRLECNAYKTELRELKALKEVLDARVSEQRVEIERYKTAVSAFIKENNSIAAESAQLREQLTGGERDFPSSGVILTTIHDVNVTTERKTIVGGHGVVKFGTWNGSRMAFKEPKVSSESTMEEIAMNMRCHGIGNVALLQGVVLDDRGRVSLLMFNEWTSDLRFLIKDRTTWRSIVDGSSYARVALGIVAASVRGLAGMHARGILHSDVHTGNVFWRLDEDTRVIYGAIGDLGRATTDDRPRKNNRGKENGNVFHAYPPCSDGEKRMTKETDVYSAGMLIRAVITGFSHPDSKTVEGCDVWKSSVREACVEETVRGLMDECCSSIPSDRPTMSEVWERLNDVYEKMMMP